MTAASPREVDLNADLGESFGVWRLGDDDAMLDVVTSANVACGFHAGDPPRWRGRCRAAAERGVRIGAQVELPRPGRVRPSLHRRRRPRTCTADVIYQIGALQALAHAAGSTVSYVKPHGALYNTIVNNHDQARAVAEAVHAVDPSLPVLGLSGSVFFAEAQRARPAHGARGVRRPRVSLRRTAGFAARTQRGAARRRRDRRSGGVDGARRAGSPPSTGRRSRSPWNPFACTVIRPERCRSPTRCGTGWSPTASN